eukprot:6189111-Pleurochrysis_carterae.AAC.1
MHLRCFPRLKFRARQVRAVSHIEQILAGTPRQLLRAPYAAIRCALVPRAASSKVALLDDSSASRLSTSAVRLPNEGRQAYSL